MTLDCGRKLFEESLLRTSAEHRIGIVGTNGTGKSTLWLFTAIRVPTRVPWRSERRFVWDSCLKQNDMDPKNTVYREEIAAGEDEIVIGEDGQTVKISCP